MPRRRPWPESCANGVARLDRRSGAGAEGGAGASDRQCEHGIFSLTSCVAFGDNTHSRTGASGGLRGENRLPCGVVCRAFHESPKRSEIAYEDDYKIHLVNADGSGARTLTGGAKQVWSPDGSRLAFTGRAWHVSVVNRDGSGLRTIGKPTPAAFSVAWSPDGTRLAYTANELESNEGVNVHVVNADGSGDHALTGPGASDGGLAWSPDGQHIAFQRGSSVSNEDGSVIDPKLWSMNDDGTAQKQLTNSSAGSDSPAWSPDGKRRAWPRHSGCSLLVDAGSSRRGFLRAAHRALRCEVYCGTRDFQRPAAPAPELSAAGANVLSRTGKTIYLLDGKRGNERILAVAASKPFGLSIEGRRVAWADDGGIRAVFLHTADPSLAKGRFVGARVLTPSVHAGLAKLL
jgi:WD40-like Beta Propeller Repeat